MIYKTYKKEIHQLIENALAEDIKGGDYTSLACFSTGNKVKANLITKESCIIAGVELAKQIFQTVDPNIIFKKTIQEGTALSVNKTVFEVMGNAHAILIAERVVLNFMQRMSGIATKTAKLVEKINHTKAKLLDTRKTIPNLRIIDKWAVKIGGGYNHRMGLYDMIMLKDNHIDYVGGIKQAIDKVKQYLSDNKLDLPIIVETRTIEDVKLILKYDTIHRILLDNFSISDTKKTVEIVNDKLPLESSGNIDEKSIVDYALCGVDYISCGALTHSVNGIDLSLKVI